MSEKGGYMGKVLRVDLSAQICKDETLPPDLLRKYVGCLGLCTKIMYDEVPPEVTIYDPRNRVVFMTGPLTGTVAPGSCRYAVLTLNSFNPKLSSPGYGGGFWAVELKQSGYDGIIIQGKAPKPVFLWVHDGHAEIRDASSLWGKDTHETEDRVKELVGSKVSVLSIGPAGENMVRGAIVSNNKNHVASKAGDVLGSKNLKAIAVGGGVSQKIPVADLNRARQVAAEWRKSMERSGAVRRRNAGNLRTWGDPKYFKDKGPWIIWVKNLSDPEYAFTYGKAMWSLPETSKVNPVYCFNCNIGCAYNCDIGTGPYKGKKVTIAGGAENYEGFAANIGVSDAGTVVYLTDLMDRVGLDSLAGQSIALAYECYEKGLLTKKETDGLELTWGNAEAAEKLVYKMIRKEGIGAILEKGSREAARILSEMTSKDLTPYSTDVKGCPAIAHHYRWSWQKILQQAVGSFGPVSQGGMLEFYGDTELGVAAPAPLYDHESAPILVKKSMIKKVFEDCFGTCMFNVTGVPGVMGYHADMISAVTGWEYTREDELELGERVVTLGRMFNLRRGLTAAEDLEFGPRFVSTPEAGLGVGHSVKPFIKKMVQDFYGVMGWDSKTGVPTKETIKKLGLDE